MNEDVSEVLKSLVNILDAYQGNTSLVVNQGQAMEGYTALAHFIEVAKKAKELTLT